MRIALVAMPWSSADLPSAAVGALSALVKRDEPTWVVTTHHPYVKVAWELGWSYELVANDLYAGELLYAAVLYPQQREAVHAYVAGWLAAQGVVGSTDVPMDAWLRNAQDYLAQSVTELADALAGQVDVIGLTTSFNQLFASLCLAKAIWERDPRVRVVLGGATVGTHAGPSLLREYPFIDAVVQGEGEKSFMRYLRAIATGVPHQAGDGLLVRGEGGAVLGEEADSAEVWKASPLATEVRHLDELPIPDFDGFFAEAQFWPAPRSITVEASRGCWWHRVYRTGRAEDTCYFCSFNSVSYREKSAQRVAAEVRELTTRHQTVAVRLVDNALRPRGVKALTDALVGLDLELNLYQELRASTHPRDLVALWEAGLSIAQVGIEGLSTGYLRCMNKGTRAIDNLQAMKTCMELEIANQGNLIAGFPGATVADVLESRANIENAANLYQPLHLTLFHLEPQSTVARQPEKFGVRLLGNDERLLTGVPEEVWRRTRFWWLGYTLEAELVDWSPVCDALLDWRALHTRLAALRVDSRPPKPLYYSDGGAFLEVVDLRAQRRVLLLDPFERLVALTAGEIRRFSELQTILSGHPELPRLPDVLARLLGERVAFREGECWLFLPVAWRPEAAARRIRQAVVV